MSAPPPRVGARGSGPPVRFLSTAANIGPRRRYRGLRLARHRRASITVAASSTGACVACWRQGREEPNALSRSASHRHVIPNVPAPVLRIREGMVLRSQNRWPSLRWDASALLGLGGGLLGAGFYYKTFMWPSWHAYEGMIRRLAGFGPAPRSSDLAPPLIEHSSCDVLVAGAGPAGLAAALAASGRARPSSSANVSPCRRRTRIRGRDDRWPPRGGLGCAPVPDCVRPVRACSRHRGHRAIGRARLRAWRRERPDGRGVAAYRAHRVVMATGAVERPIAFVDNDRPGVMLLGAADHARALWRVRWPACRAVWQPRPSLRNGGRLRAGGMQIAAVVDVRQADLIGRTPGALETSPGNGSRDHNDAPAQRESLLAAGVECLAQHAVISAHGRLAVRAAQIAPLAGTSANGDGGGRRIIAMSC